ncbi:MAG TPA: exosortase K [Polyangia bacterium]
METPSTTRQKAGTYLRWLRLRVALPLLYVAGAATAYSLKAFFSAANADDLRWVLAPTCWMAGWLGGMTFTPEGGAGYISHDQRLVVGTACSGLNFLIACFATLFFAFAHRPRHGLARAAWLPASLALAWAATVATNAVRVMVAGPLYQADIYGAVLTPLRAHRIMGTLLYCTSLFAVHAAAARLWGARAAPQGGSSGDGGGARWLRALARSPLAFYLGIVIAVPIARRGVRGVDGRLLEHVGSVLGIVVLLLGLSVIAKGVANRIHSNLSRK